MPCFHRREKKDSPNKSNIPEFYLSCEDITWPFERITKVCPKYTNLINMIERGSEKPTIWDICCASINCKEGCEVKFKIDFEFKSNMLGTVMEPLFFTAVKKLVAAFEKRARDLYGAPSNSSQII